MSKIYNDFFALVDYVDSIAVSTSCPMVGIKTPDSIEAQMFKLRRADNGAAILVTDLDGNLIEPICRFGRYLLAKGYSPNTALA